MSYSRSESRDCNNLLEAKLEIQFCLLGILGSVFELPRPRRSHLRKRSLYSRPPAVLCILILVVTSDYKMSLRDDIDLLLKAIFWWNHVLLAETVMFLKNINQHEPSLIYMFVLRVFLFSFSKKNWVLSTRIDAFHRSLPASQNSSKYERINYGKLNSLRIGIFSCEVLPINGDKWLLSGCVTSWFRNQLIEMNRIVVLIT